MESKFLRQTIALKTLVDPKHAASAMVFICFEEGAMIIGQDIDVCGGGPCIKIIRENSCVLWNVNYFYPESSIGFRRSTNRICIGGTAWAENFQIFFHR